MTMLYVIGYFMMTVSHFGQFVMEKPGYSLIGLVVLSIFGLLVAYGSRKTKNVSAYATRLAIMDSMFLICFSTLPSELVITVSLIS